MHELAITERLIRVIVEKARSSAFTKVEKVRLEVGCLSSIEPDSVEFCFDIVAKGTIVEGAQLEIIRKLGTADCLDCGKTASGLERFGELCPDCGGCQLRVTSGTEVFIRDMEVQ